MHDEELDQRRQTKPPEHRVGIPDAFEIEGRGQLEFLRSVGLKPYHTLLDVGCGCLRGGRWISDYLDPGNYSGFDKSEELLTKGLESLDASCRELVKPRTCVMEIGIHPECILDRFGTMRFDFIWINYVFDHIDPFRIAALLHACDKITTLKSQVIASFFLNPYSESWTDSITRWIYNYATGSKESMKTYTDREHWHHTPSFFADLTRGYDLSYRGWCFPHRSNPYEGLVQGVFRKGAKDESS